MTLYGYNWNISLIGRFMQQSTHWHYSDAAWLDYLSLPTNCSLSHYNKDWIELWS